METSLLATKLRIPPPSRHVVQRARLVDALEQGILDYKLILLSAPAGYGKSTLLAQWAHTSRFPVVWLSVDKGDNDLDRFFRYLLTGWEEIHPSLGESPLGLLLGGISPDSDAVLAAFINVANNLPEHTIFVLDDAHLLDDETIHQALTFLLDHLPPTLHFVLAGRGEPPLPLARYRARHELLELRTEALCFSMDESSEFLRQQLGLNHEEVATLHAQLEGWIAGLQLAAISLRRHRGAALELAVSGRQRFIADYLSTEVLAQLPGGLRWFLLQTSILERLCGPLCDAVTGQEDGQETLDLLERENLFLAPLDDRRAWYRYHGLFADFLQEELGRHHPTEVAELHRRAARWYLAHDLADAAFSHAVGGHDPALVVEIVDRYIFTLLWSGEFRVLQRWLEALPAEWCSAYPMLDLARSGYLALTGQFDACIRCVDDVEQRLLRDESEDRHWQLARVTAVRCTIACVQNDLPLAEAYADQALRGLREGDLSFQAEIYHALGDTYRRNGRWEEARDQYLKELELTNEPTFPIRSVHVFGALADLDLRQGHLQNAAGYWRKALAAIQERETWGRLPLPVIGWVYVRMAELLYEWNELAAAWEHLARGLERAELGGDVRALIAGYLIAARMQLTQGNAEMASTYLERTRPLVEQAAFPDWTSRFERCQLELWLAQDQLRAAVLWADALQGRPEREIDQLAVARVLIVKGDGPSIEQALALLDGLLQVADAEDRMGVQIEALALQALARWRCGERVGAMTSLEHALRLAEPEGYVRLFADLGLPLSRLLQEARSRAVLPDYVTMLLAACGAHPALSASAEHVLSEPLSRREQEILELLAAGLTNREIADQLVISPETVKKHAGNIYGKLGVRSRRQAAARAREWALLG